ncbi:hypothetical protein KFK09_015973 [Dendrobium nobile]|uniref:Uncharacterized protein n=1 Tax=Dendrobium nobile TaxID=94219 RepID=A0A8T3BBZ4_DENNO|nr:hypothetical protein KFK09_015973 [Dendrobium nobile]
MSRSHDFSRKSCYSTLFGAESIASPHIRLKICDLTSIMLRLHAYKMKRNGDLSAHSLSTFHARLLLPYDPSTRSISSRLQVARSTPILPLIPRPEPAELHQPDPSPSIPSPARADPKR